MNRETQSAVIDKVKKPIFEWSINEEIAFFRIEFVVPFVANDFSFRVFVFCRTAQEVINNEKNGVPDHVQKHYLELLH